MQRARRAYPGMDANAVSCMGRTRTPKIQENVRMNTPDPTAPAELAQGKDAGRGEAAPSIPAARAEPGDTAGANHDAGPQSGENARDENARATPPTSERDLRAGLFFAPYRW